MSNELHHLDDYEWIGEFWVPCPTGKVLGSRFPGVLKYSSSAGLTISATMKSWPGDDTDPRWKIMHGVVPMHGEVTLYSVLRSLDTTYSSASPMFQVELFCKHALFGGHFELGSRFSRCVVEFNNLGEFFHPQGFALSDTYSSEPLFDSAEGLPCRTPPGSHGGVTVSIEKFGTGVMASEDFSKLFMLDEAKDSALIDDLDQVGKELFHRHEISSLSRKSKIQYAVHFDSTNPNGETTEILNDGISSIQSLLSILLLKTVRATRKTFTVTASGEGGSETRKARCLSSLWLTERQLGPMNNDKTHYLGLPMTSSALKNDYKAILQSWFKFMEREVNLVSRTVLTRIAENNDDLQMFVLQIAAIEQCQAIEDRSQYRRRFQWFAEEYGTDILRARLLEHLPIGAEESEIGELLAAIRNCISHPAKLKESSFSKLEGVIDGVGISNITEVLHLMLVIYIYRTIQLDDGEMERFCENIERHLREYSAWN